MGVIAVVAAEVREVRHARGYTEVYQVKVTEVVTAGQVLCWAAAGTMSLADGNDAALDEPQAVALQGGAAGQVISVLKYGRVEGFTVSAIATGVLVTLTDNPGEIESAGAGECVGRIVAESGAAAADRVICFDFNTCLKGVG
jgi:predicted RecA/RadA family phage recombinase